MDTAGGMLHDEQHIEPVRQYGVNAEEVGDENAVGLGGQKLPPVGPSQCHGR
jgi:hypothetical protein